MYCIHLFLKQVKNIVINLKHSFICTDFPKCQKSTYCNDFKDAGYNIVSGDLNCLFSVSVFVIIRSLFSPPAQPFLKQTRPSISGFCTMSLLLKAEP